MGIEDVVDGKVKASAEPVVETPQEPAPEATAEAIEPTQEPAPEPVETPEAPAEPKEGPTVPLAAMLDIRDGKKAAEERARQLERELAEMRAAQQPQKTPDPLDDPDGFNAHVGQRIDQTVSNAVFRMSEGMAKREHGAEAVDAATAWAMERAKSDPTFVQGYMTSEHPIDWIVRQHQRDGLLSQIGDASNLDEWVKTFVAQNGERLGLTAPATAPAAVVPQQAPATPPRSLASQPSTGGGVKDVPIGPMAGLAQLEAVINR